MKAKIMSIVINIIAEFLVSDAFKSQVSKYFDGVVSEMITKVKQERSK